MKHCEADFIGGKEHLQCLTHGGGASHCAPNGDDWVCQEYADVLGCSCCPKNYDKTSRVSVNVGDEIVVENRVFKLMDFFAGDGESAALALCQVFESDTEVPKGE